MTNSDKLHEFARPELWDEKDADGKDGHFYIGKAHRLDRDTAATVVDAFVVEGRRYVNVEIDGGEMVFDVWTGVGEH